MKISRLEFGFWRKDGKIQWDWSTPFYMSGLCGCKFITINGFSITILSKQCTQDGINNEQD